MADAQTTTTYKDFSVVDLFCGVGGLAHGFKQQDFTVDAGIDFDKTCRFAFETNNQSSFLHKDITKLKASELNELFSKRKILVGCAPCQPFSIYNNKDLSDLENKQKTDSKWKLLDSFADLIEQVEPEVISMENVPLLITYNGGSVFNAFVNRLREKNYTVSWSVVNAQDYEIPQRRKRLILFGSKHGEVDLISKVTERGKHKTVRDAIGHLPSVEDGMADPNDPLHRASKLSPLNKKRIQATSEGGFWRDWDKELWLECHKKDSGKSFRSVYGRMKWDEVAPTMTTYCNGLGKGRFGHPEQDRAITLREASLIQSFPDDYNFYDPNEKMYSTTIARHIGNAVPVLLGAAIAKSIKNHIKTII